MTDERATLLVVDDDRRLRELTHRYLSENGFIVKVAANAHEAREKLLERPYDLIVLDVMMPGQTGLEFTRAAKGNTLHPAYSTPILLLTAMGEGADRIEGLESGADDYLSKPFEPKELVLRIRKILSRVVYAKSAGKSVSLGNAIFDLQSGELRSDTKRILLTSAEMNLLKILALNSGRPFSREDLAAKIGVSLSPRTVDVQVTRLRRKIEPDPRQPQFLKTVRHKGYGLWPG